jgi:hypothetical protein
MSGTTSLLLFRHFGVGHLSEAEQVSQDAKLRQPTAPNS